MSMSAEHAESLKNENAVVCCRTEAGTILSADNLEDPDIFPDMVDSGLLTIPDDCLKVGQVIGGKLIKTIDSLTPLTPDIVEGYKEMETSEKSEPDTKKQTEDTCEDEKCEAVYADEVDNSGQSCTISNGVLKINIEEGKGIEIEIPFN